MRPAHGWRRQAGGPAACCLPLSAPVCPTAWRLPMFRPIRAVSCVLVCLGLKSVYPQRNLRHRPACYSPRPCRHRVLHLPLIRVQRAARVGGEAGHRAELCRRQHQSGGEPPRSCRALRAPYYWPSCFWLTSSHCLAHPLRHATSQFPGPAPSRCGWRWRRPPRLRRIACMDRQPPTRVWPRCRRARR